MGRPRKFDIDRGLRIATDLFWRKGFDGTSLQDLTEAMGITPPSFYFAFDSKEALFHRVVEAYQQVQAAVVADALNQKAIGTVVEKLLLGFADLLTNPDHAPGCLMMNNSLPIAEGQSFRRLFAEQREAFRLQLQRRLERARRTDHSPPGRGESKALARTIVALIWGFAVEAQSGASRADLRQAARAAAAMICAPALQA